MSALLDTPLIPWGTAPVQRRAAELVAAHAEADADAVTGAVTAAQDAQLRLSGGGGLNLYAGSNVLSPRVRAAHTADLASRPAIGWPGEKIQPALGPIEELEVIVAQQLRNGFGGRFADGRFVTATLANLAAYAALAAPGDTIATLPPSAGSHTSHLADGTAGVRGLRGSFLPVDSRSGEILDAELVDFVRDVRPRIILVGGSVIQFPTRIGPLRDAADRVGARLIFDASHVAGLIAAGEFPNPLAEGADLLTFSTYKTLAGPAGGAAVTDEPEVAERMGEALAPVLSSNYDPARLGPLAIATAEAVEQRPAWAKRTIELAVALGERLHAHGLTLLGADRGITATHQVVVDAAPWGGGARAMRALEAGGVFVGACRLPHQSAGEEAGGIRLGTQEIVRLGAGFEHAEPIAALIAALLRGDFADAERSREIRRSFGSDLWGRPAPCP